MRQPVIQLPEGQTIHQAIAYRVPYTKYPRWQFWRTEKVKTNIAVMTDQGHFYIFDPDEITLEEKPNNY